MQVTNKFTIGIHLVVATKYFQDRLPVTSKFLSSSIGANSVMVREVMLSLKNEDILDISQGKTGIRLKKELKDITFFDIYCCVSKNDDRGIFHFHEHPSNECPIGKNIHEALDDKLDEVQLAMENKMKEITLDSVYEDLLIEINKGEKQ